MSGIRWGFARRLQKPFGSLFTLSRILSLVLLASWNYLSSLQPLSLVLKLPNTVRTCKCLYKHPSLSGAVVQFYSITSHRKPILRIFATFYHPVTEFSSHMVMDHWVNAHFILISTFWAKKEVDQIGDNCNLWKMRPLTILCLRNLDGCDVGGTKCEILEQNFTMAIAVSIMVLWWWNMVKWLMWWCVNE